MPTQKELDRLTKEWEKRMKSREEAEDKEKRERAEQLRQNYLIRTGRKEMKP